MIPDNIFYVLVAKSVCVEVISGELVGKSRWKGGRGILPKGKAGNGEGAEGAADPH